MPIKPKFALLLASAALFAVPTAAFAQDEGTSEESGSSSSSSSIRLSTGVSYSSGEYGELEATDVIAIPLSLTYSDSGLKVRISVPYVMIDGPGSLLQTPEGRDSFFDGGGQGRGRGRGGNSDDSNSGSGSSGSSNSGSGSSGSGSSGSGSSGSSGGGSDIEVEDELDGEVIADDNVTDGDGFAALDNNRAGFGDVNVSALYSFELFDGTYFEPQVKVKLPTASRADRLGTGEFDITLSADLVQEVGPASIYIHGRRKFTGQPAGSTIRSTWGAGAGLSLDAGSGFHFGADYFWQQSAFAARPASQEVSGWLSTRLGESFSLTIYGGTGLNNDSADVFGGASVGVRF